MEKKRILFVDDEENVLGGLRRMLRPLRTEWDMSFAGSGEDALRQMAESPFDMVVSDMKMPGMTGDVLLQKVKEKYPNTIRIILSGLSDESVFIRLFDSSHQILSEPCDAATLSSTILRILHMRKRLPDDVLAAILNQIEALPSIPDVYYEVMKEADISDSSLQKLAELIACDMAMSSKILQLVNSAFFGFSRQISNIQEAITLLGTQRIKNLLFGIHIFTIFSGDSMSRTVFQELWEHSLRCSGLAVRLSSKLGLTTLSAEHALAGLLHDVGKLVLLSSFPEKYPQLLFNSQAHSSSLLEAERHQFHTTHAEIGAYLLGIWGIPDNLIEAVLHHHAPGESTCADGPTPLTTAYLANAFDLQIAAGIREFEKLDLDVSYLTGIFPPETIRTLWELCLTDIHTTVPE